MDILKLINMKTIKILFVLFIFSLKISAQSNADLARHYYFKGQEQFASEAYADAHKSFIKAIELRGKNDFRVQSYFVKIAYAQKKYENCKIEFQKYFSINPKKDFSYKEILNISIEVNEILNKREQKRIAKQEAEYDKKQKEIKRENDFWNDSKSIDNTLSYIKYINAYPYGKYAVEAKKRRDETYPFYKKKVLKSRDISQCETLLKHYKSKEVEQLLEELKDDDAWATAKYEQNTNAYYEYLSEYPTGGHSDVASETIKDWDKTAFDKAVSRNTQYGYNSYLKNYPKGNYRYEAKNKIKTLEGIDAYDSANSNYHEKEYYDAKKQYEKALSKDSYAYYVADARKMLKKSQHKIDIDTDELFLEYIYSKKSNMGFSMTHLTNGLSARWGARMSDEIMYSYDEKYEIDNSGNTTAPSSYPYSTKPTGNVVDKNWAAFFGLNYRLFYPVWIYVGGGYGETKIIEEVKLYSHGDLDETYWMINTDKSIGYFFPEFGVVINVLDKLSISYTINYYSKLENKVNHQFGVGISLFK